MTLAVFVLVLVRWVGDLAVEHLESLGGLMVWGGLVEPVWGKLGMAACAVSAALVIHAVGLVVVLLVELVGHGVVLVWRAGLWLVLVLAAGLVFVPSAVVVVVGFVLVFVVA